MKNILMNIEMAKAILDDRKIQTRRIVNCRNRTEIQLDDFASRCGYFDGSKNYGCNHEKCGEVDEEGNGKCFTWSCPLAICGYETEEDSEDYSSFDGDNYVYLPKPKYQKDDIIWVREPAKIVWYQFSAEDWKDNLIEYQYSDSNKSYEMIIPDRFLQSSPKWITGGGIPNGCIKEMARIFLKITDVRVERLQDISVEDIIKEGVVVNTQSLEKYCNTDEEFDLSVRESYYLEFEELWNRTSPKGYKWGDNPYVFVYEFEKVDKCRSA